jgi:hypothetical protein
VQANTTAVIYTDKVISHYEGGWPKEVDFTEAEHVIRYRKKVEKDEEYINTVVALGSSIEELIKQVLVKHEPPSPSLHPSLPATLHTFAREYFVFCVTIEYLSAYQ